MGATRWVKKHNPTLNELGNRILDLPPNVAHYEEWLKVYDQKRNAYEATLNEQAKARGEYKDWYVDSRTWERDHERDPNLPELQRRKLAGALDNVNRVVEGYDKEVSNRSSPSAISMPTEGSPPPDVDGKEVFTVTYLQSPPERVTVGGRLFGDSTIQ